MTELTAQLGTQHRINETSHPDSRNAVHIFDPLVYRKPEYWVYLYTISDRDFLVSQPPLVPGLQIRAKKPGERYAFVTKIPSPMVEVYPDVDTSDFRYSTHVGERVAQSICNPDNTTLDQNFTAAKGLGIGTNLNEQGVFWSLNDPPKEEEIKAAEARREKYYRGLIEKARTLEISNPKELEATITQDYHLAAEYFGLETTWHYKMVKKEECPNCGDSVKPGVAYHYNAAGALCVIDERRAKKAGVLKD